MRTRGLVCGGLALLAVIAPVRAQRPAPIPPARLVRGTLSFDGHSTLGDFVGTTDSVRGEMAGGLGLAPWRRWGGGRAGAPRNRAGGAGRGPPRPTGGGRTPPTLRRPSGGVAGGAAGGDG